MTHAIETTAAAPSANSSAAETLQATARFVQAIPCLSYADAHAGIDWLVQAFGAEARHVYDGPNNTVAHAEVWFGGCCVMMGSMKANNMPPNRAGQTSVYIVVSSAAEVDALYARAVEHGARVAIPLQDTDYGSHDFAALDPEGNFWSFGTYAPV